MASSLALNRHGVDVIVLAHRLMATHAFVGERRILAIGLQVGTAPSSPSPPFGCGIFLAVANHEFDLNKPTSVDHTLIVRLLLPGHLREGGAVRPGTDVVFGDGFHRDVVAEYLPHRVIVPSVG